MCILLVEDEFLIRADTGTALVDAGYEVIEAEHGAEAFQHMDTYPGRFTFLVTDYHMPGEITGQHVIERMRPAYPTIGMILASAFPRAISQQWRERHRVELLVKPYDPDELLSIVMRLLS